jgi:hypothetical protein
MVNQKDRFTPYRRPANTEPVKKLSIVTLDRDLSSLRLTYQLKQLIR